MVSPSCTSTRKRARTLTNSPMDACEGVILKDASGIDGSTVRSASADVLCPPDTPRMSAVTAFFPDGAFSGTTIVAIHRLRCALYVIGSDFPKALKTADLDRKSV